MRIGILIVAYEAESTITEVLSRIPNKTWKKITEVFLFDDSSKDNTVEKSINYKGLGQEKIKIFRNQTNLGYGGNQKRGYLYAIKNNLDVVVLLHGDGQYAPECLDTLITPIVNGEADAVFGSRMITKGAASDGGMPMYKYLGNKILTYSQNKLLTTELSEFHSGYRAYRVETLKKMSLLNYTNDFHFDTQIIIQLLDIKARIAEVAIPVYYGDEICRVNGIKYAFDVMISTLKYRLHKSGIVDFAEYQQAIGGEKYNFKYNYYSSHNIILRKLDSKQKKLKILDIGCGSGILAAKMAKIGHEVTGIDIHDHPNARKVCHEFIVQNTDEPLLLTESYENYFDVIVFADILEHLRAPANLLVDCRKYLTEDGKIIASTGNVAHIFIRMMLFFGIFNYTEKGILDKTHTHLFTRKSFIKILENTGYEIESKSYTPIPFENIINTTKVADFLTWVNMLFVKLRPPLFAFQFVVEGKINLWAKSEMLRENQLHAPYVDEK